MVGAIVVCLLILSGAVGLLPLVALHYLFAMSALVATVCLGVLALVAGIRVMRWALFLDDPSPRQPRQQPAPVV